MKTFKFGKITVYSDLPDILVDEAQKYVAYTKKYLAENPKDDANLLEFNHGEIHVKQCDDGKIDVKYILRSKTGFERIRRITGYLTGNLDTWNNAKRAEERERVKHSTTGFCSDC